MRSWKYLHPPCLSKYMLSSFNANLMSNILRELLMMSEISRVSPHQFLQSFQSLSHMPRNVSQEDWSNSTTNYTKIHTCTCSWKRIGSSCAILPIFQPRISVVLMCLSAKFWPFIHAILSRSPPFTKLEQEALPQQNQILKSEVEKETSHVIMLLSSSQSD